MQHLRIAVATKSFSQPLKQSLRTAAEMGARGIQLDVPDEIKPADLSDTGRRQFLNQADELGLAVASLNLTLRKTLFDPERLEDRLASIKNAMQFAFQLKAKTVAARIGRIPADPQSPDYLLLQETVTNLARHSNHVGVTLAITPTSDPPERLAEFVGSIESGPLGVNFDPAGFVMSGHDPAEAFRTLHDMVAHVRIRDGVRDVDGSGLEVPVGRGEVEWAEMLALLEEAAYKGWLVVDRTQGDDKPGDTARAIRYLQQVALG
jgi:sugar phosphate isomerase/epimerase